MVVMTVKVLVRVREFDMEKDLPAVEELERRCQVGLSGDMAAVHDRADDGDDDGVASREKKTSKKTKKKEKTGMSLCVEQIGDPLARVRHAPEHVMLVAEYGEEKKMVGVIKACVKTVSRGGKQRKPYVKVAYLLGLRVSPSHRRLGIATALVRRAEEWCRERGAEHATMATTESNAASLALFTGRFGYAPFRRPEFIGHPVHAHRLPVPRGHRVFQLPPELAAAAYARLLPPQDTDFLPADMPALLSHKLTLGTFVAIADGVDTAAAAADTPPSFAVLSVWDSTRFLSLRVSGAPALLRASLAALRALDRRAPWLHLPSIPDIFRPFGAYLLYGLRMSGPEGPALLRSLCHHAHNVARKNPACAVVAADISPDDPCAAAVPRWRRFSCDEDVWCIKNLNPADQDNADDDWTAPSPPPGRRLFVDPREF
ncbi:probable N-acetyltransferase HLS1 [Oryza brachyantha]|uniref:probable N-acetyltransferase HLS1 n=1 Tax=Oryza brachyantha TaxID=4533 RepID=UPI001ADA329F|nr:probable N-acetyltransferase HLS1 [Oryza brachyantha]